VSIPHLGVRHDFSIFQDSIPVYRDFLLKRPGDEALDDPIEGQTSWALLADKGSMGANGLVRPIIPKKALPNRRLSTGDIIANERLAGARVICENFYGRLKGLFSICSGRFRGFYIYSLFR
jgi:hypothetical protein